MTRYIVGDPVVLTNTFAVSGTNTDPDTVSLDVTDPSGTTTTYTYAGATITKSAVGVYTKTVTVDAAGTWTFKWTGTGTAADVEDGTFEVFSTSVTKLYATIDMLKSYLRIDDATDDVQLQMAVASASRVIDGYCNRFFYQQAGTRLFTPSDSGELLLGVDLVSITTLKSDEDGDGTYEATWTTGDYRLKPSNAAADSRPYTRIDRSPEGDYSFPLVDEGVEVVGTFGWPSVPDDVKTACVIQAAKIFQVSKDGGGGFGDFQGNSMQMQSRYIERSTEMMLRPYRVRVAV